MGGPPTIDQINYCRYDVEYRKDNHDVEYTSAEIEMTGIARIW